MTIGKGISEAQKRRLEALKLALRQHVDSGEDQRWSTRDPIRAWVSYCKNSQDALRLKKEFEKELSTMGPKPYRDLSFVFNQYRGFV